jgi:hypothetical protein
MFKIGRPEDFLNKRDMLFDQIIYANKKFDLIKKNKLKEIEDKLDEHTVFFLKGYGTDRELASCFRELFFNGRELLDLLLHYIHKKADRRTSKKFLPFAKNLMKNKYDQINLDIIKFLKVNITFIFNIRKIRNEIKNNISNIEFMFNRDHFEARFKVPIKSEEEELIPCLDVNNKDKAIENNSYSCVIILDEYFPEMIQFWRHIFTYLI